MKIFTFEYKENGIYKHASYECFSADFAQAMFFDNHPEVTHCYLMTVPA